MTDVDASLRSAGLPDLPRRLWLEIDVGALAHNLRTIRTLTGPGVRIGAVVKADGYGHGLEVAARTFTAAGAELLCVASLDEAIAVRTAGINGPVLTLYPVPPAALADAAAAGIETVVASIEGLEELVAGWTAGRAAQLGVCLPVHLEVETGLGRGGVPMARVPALVRRLAATPGVEVRGLWSHLSEAGEHGLAAEQHQRLESAAEALRANGLPVPPLHLSATGGLFAGSAPELAMVRPGLGLYGELPAGLPIAPGARAAEAALQPAMRLVANPVRVQELKAGSPVGYGGRWRAPAGSVVATLPIGYADGYPRILSPGAFALVRGRRVPVVGTIAMDALAVDVTRVPGVHAGDEFVFLGAQGDERITAQELARLRTTIPWEVMTSMARRIPRVYHAPAGTVGMRTLAGEFLVGARPDPAAS